MNNYIIIAGPCAAESEEQVLRTAEQIPADKVSFFRAGLWKPRTSPNSFQGVGAKGVKWMQRVREQFGLKIATEVATPEHVAKCRDVEFDALWIGARTVSDPFAVQALSEYLMGFEGTVLVKNPITDDVDLWQGAIQRLQLMGITNIIAVQRGVKSSVYNPTELRNNPMWSMPIELKRRMPDIPIISDPSHITGSADKVPAMAQQAISLGLDGLMIEVHNEPLKALSDKRQQLTPKQFIQLLDSINYRNQIEPKTELVALREQIDEVDAQLWQLIEQRMRLSEQIGAIKQEIGLPIFQPERYKEILVKRIEWARENNLSEKLIIDVTQALHSASVQQQLKNKQ